MIEENLPKIAERVFGAKAELANAHRLSGGASAETWAFGIEKSGSITPYILRKGQGAKAEADERLSARDEASIIMASQKSGAKVPDIIHICDDEDGIGEAYIMSFLEGETLGARIARKPEFESVRDHLAAECGSAIAAIHKVSLEGLPQGLETIYALDELTKYRAIYDEAGCERPVLELAFKFLEKRAPKEATPRLLHGDFRNGNIIVHPEKGLQAVIDWELAHLGDPASDLGWICVNSWRFGRPENPVGGFGQYDQMLEAYLKAGGDESVTLERVQYWEMLGSLKWGVMTQMMYMSFKNGMNRSVERPMIGTRTSETEIDLINLMERAA